MMCTHTVRMLWLLIALISCWAVSTAPPEIVLTGLNSGTARKGQPGLLITNHRSHTKKECVKLDPRNVHNRQLTTTAQMINYTNATWSRQILRHAEVDTTNMLQQLQKLTVSRTESLFSVETPAVDSVNLNAVGELEEILDVRPQICEQSMPLQTKSKTLKDTVRLNNTHRETLSKAFKAIDVLLSVVGVNLAHAQRLSMPVEDMLCKVGSFVDGLAVGKFPSFFVHASLVLGYSLPLVLAFLYTSSPTTKLDRCNTELATLVRKKGRSSPKPEP